MPVYDWETANDAAMKKRLVQYVPEYIANGELQNMGIVMSGCAQINKRNAMHMQMHRNMQKLSRKQSMR